MDGLGWSDDLLDEASRTHDAVAAALQAMGVEGELLLTGGTSVPGALTKGDVDLHLRVQPERFHAVVARLGAVYPTASPQAWAETLAVFEVPGSRATSIAVTPRASEHDVRFTETWAALRSRPELLAEYNALKEGATPEEYERRKSKFFTKLSEQQR